MSTREQAERHLFAVRVWKFCGDLAAPQHLQESWVWKFCADKIVLGCCCPCIIERKSEGLSPSRGFNVLLHSRSRRLLGWETPYHYFDELTFKGGYGKFTELRVQPLLIMQTKEKTVKIYHNLYITETHIVGMFRDERQSPLQALAREKPITV